MERAAIEPDGSGPGDRGDRSAAHRWIGIDHVQLAIPPGGEDAARAFYVGVLGLTEVPKPAALAVRGGAWFEAGAVRIHVGREDDFVPARRAHPALLVSGLRELVSRTGLEARWDDDIPGVTRCHVTDPFGNRIELIEAGSAEGAP
jgi:catechol 2,3-dioxygenase-like lactoylglutathione lyase family enzyme